MDLDKAIKDRQSIRNFIDRSIDGYTYLQAHDDYQERSPSIDLPFKESFKTIKRGN